MVEFASGVKKMALNSENENVRIFIFGSDTAIVVKFSRSACTSNSAQFWLNTLNEGEFLAFKILQQMAWPTSNSIHP